jgi:hypothetical protein
MGTVHKLNPSNTGKGHSALSIICAEKLLYPANFGHGNEMLRVRIIKSDNEPQIDCRIFYVDPLGDIGPSHKGFALRLADIETLTNGLAEALQRASSMGLLPQGGAA